MVKKVLIIECVPRYNWYNIFKNGTLTSGEEIIVEQATWNEVNMTAYDDGLVITLGPAKKPLPDTTQNKSRTIRPDFILFRTLCQHIGGLNDKKFLYGIKYCNIPSINSVDAIYGMLEKPYVYGELKRIQQDCSDKNMFPLIEQTYYPSYKSMVISPGFPCVIKIGPYHAGYGKIKCESQARFDDIRSIVALHNDYCTAEPWIDWDYEIRIQKIGSDIKCFKRQSMNWKGNVGNMSKVENVEVTDEFKFMINRASSIFGGMDICALDLVHDKKTDKFIILELNGTAIGLVKAFEETDMNLMRDLVIAKMSKIYKKNADQKEQTNDNNNNNNDIKMDEETKENNDDTNNDETLLQAIQKIRKLEQENNALKESQINDKKKKDKDCVIM